MPHAPTTYVRLALALSLQRKQLCTDSAAARKGKAKAREWVE
jgi:hypothetical protein